MKLITLLLTILLAGGAIVWLIDRLFYNNKTGETTDETDDNHDAVPPQQGCVDESCGIRSICPSEQILQAACKQQPTYYEDEELDAFSGRGEHDYTPDEEELWRDILYTLRPGDRLGWGQSVQHRGLVMPAAVREEFLQLASEQPHAEAIK